MNTLVCGFYQPFINASIKYLVDNKVITLKKWIVAEGYENLGLDQKLFFQWEDLMDRQDIYKNLESCPADIYEKLYPYFPMFHVHLVRESYFESLTYYECQVFTTLFLNFFYTLIKKEKIELILFGDVPHGAYNFIIYCLARALGIKILFVEQSFEFKTFFIYSSLEEIGRFSNLNIRQNSIPDVKIEEKFEKDLFYMKMPTSRDKLQKKAVLFIHPGLWCKNRFQMLREKRKRYKTIHEYLTYKDLRTVSRLYQEKEYKHNKKIFFSKAADFAQKFVYFPLHLQPEMTTDTLGGVYYDQLLAIEHLSQMLPQDWKIYVKENPKQTEYMRGRAFFIRLGAIDKVVGVKSDTNTYDLIRHSQFVATITGTAGWEAISGGKSVLVFAYAWYRYLPGVTIYHPGVTYRDVLSNIFSHEELEAALNKLRKGLYTGIVNEDYCLSQIASYNKIKNCLMVGQALASRITTL